MASAQQIVQITHFMGASSSTRDWARYYSFTALLDTDFIMASFEKKAVPASRFIQQRSNSVTKEYSDVVHHIDDSNVAIILHQAHFVILSTTQLTATVNPCTVLSLHEESYECTWARCAKLRQINSGLYIQ